MKVSYLGISKTAMSVTSALRRYIKMYRHEHPGITPPLELGGVYISDIGRSAVFAAENDMYVHYSMEEVFKKADIIFVFLSKNGLHSLPKRLKRSGIRDKIICHFDPGFNADILDFGSENTYVSFLIPILSKASRPNRAYHVISEGYGDRYDEVKYLTDMLELNCTFLTPKEKCIYTTGVDFLKTYPLMLERIGHFLIKVALASDKSLCDDIISKISSKDYIANPDADISNLDYDYILKQEKILKDIVLNYINKAYAGMIAAISEFNDFDADLKAAIARKTKRMFSE